MAVVGEVSKPLHGHETMLVDIHKSRQEAIAIMSESVYNSTCSRRLYALSSNGFQVHGDMVFTLTEPYKTIVSISCVLSVTSILVLGFSL